MKCSSRLALIGIVLLVAAEVVAQPVLILYPSVREPYGRIYRDTLAGIEQVYRGESRIVLVQPGQRLALELLVGSAPQIAVALGNSAARTLSELQLSVPVISTATAEMPFAVHRRLAYYPDPPLLLKQLQRFKPGVERIKLVAAPDIDDYIDEVREVVTNAGVQLDVCDAETLKSAADCYRRLLGEASPADAIWLLQGGKLLEPALLSYILDVAWRRQLPVFSSNPSHAGRGALFALYPDNEAAGRQIGGLIKECLQQCNAEAPRISYLREMKIVLNERTSRHLGLDIAPEARQGVDLTL